MPITDIRVIQIWGIEADGTPIQVNHYFEVQRNNEEAWEQLEIINALRSDKRQQGGQTNNVDQSEK